MPIADPLARWGRFVLLAIVFAGATYLLGWYAVPLVGGLWGVARSTGNPALEAGTAAAAGWAALLVQGLALASYAPQLGRIAGVMQLPVIAIVIITLLFPFLLGWSAARAASVIGIEIRNSRSRAEARSIAP